MSNRHVRTSLRSVVAAPLKRLPHRFLIHPYYAIHRLFIDLPNNYAGRCCGLTELSSSTCFRKTSDTVFILGSGSSINSISDERWSVIRSHDSFGFNFWLLHEHVPSLYAMEAMDIGEAGGWTWDVGVRLARAAAKRERDYGRVALLLTDLSFDRVSFVDLLPAFFRSRLCVVRTIPAFARSRDELVACIRLLKSRGVFERGCVDRVFKYRASVSMLVALAVRLGYRKIVLCGIDLSNPDYFYQDPSLYPETTAFFSSRRVSERVHSTLIELPMMRPIDEVLVVMRDLVLGPMGVDLFVENRNSALYPRIPLAPADLFRTDADG